MAITLDELYELTLRERIRRLREDGPAGRLSHDRLAEALGTSRQTVINWEKGAQPKPEFVAKLASYFEVPAELFQAPRAEAVTLARLADRLGDLEGELVELAQEIREGLKPLGDRFVELERRIDALEQAARTGKRPGAKTAKGTQS